MNLYFSETEKKEFLKKKGYSEKEVVTWRNYSVYHNHSDTEYKTVTAYLKQDEKIDLDKDNQIRHDDFEFHYSLDAKFNRELRKAFLAL